jgi:hypothetical protein
VLSVHNQVLHPINFTISPPLIQKPTYRHSKEQQ